MSVQFRSDPRQGLSQVKLRLGHIERGLEEDAMTLQHGGLL